LLARRRAVPSLAPYSIPAAAEAGLCVGSIFRLQRRMAAGKGHVLPALLMPVPWIETKIGPGQDLVRSLTMKAMPRISAGTLV
jgi:hypothetical protein